MLILSWSQITVILNVICDSDDNKHKQIYIVHKDNITPW